MEFVAEIVAQALAEILLQAVAEILAELGYHSLADKVLRRRHPVLAAIGFAIVGGAVGGLSLIPFPEHAIHDPTLMIANLVLTPVAVGLVMVLIGRWRTRHGQELVRLDRFAFAFVFAFSMALVRYLWAG